MTKKEQLIQDIQNLLNSYEHLSNTTINPNILMYMDEQTIINIISDLLQQKEDLKESDLLWLEKFKKNLD